MLRSVHEVVRDRLLQEANAQGFDVSLSEFAVFQHPGPDSLRPIDLARRCNLSKQAMNYMLASLEGRGYLTRELEAGRRASFVRLTSRGQALMTQFRTSVLRIEREWAEQLGAARFDELSATLHDLAVWLGKIPST